VANTHALRGSYGFIGIDGGLVLSHAPVAIVPSGRILIVDDDAGALNALAAMLSGEGYETEIAADGRAALARIGEWSPELVLTDLHMPNLDGLGLLAALRESRPDVAVILMTAYGEVQTAVAAIRSGAADYLVKPLEPDQLSVVVENTLERYRLRAEVRRLQDRLNEARGFDDLVGESPQMHRVFKTVEQVASSRATVLITGASGTGKELVAASLHRRSPRARGPFIKVNCAALSEGLLESELFGHERGSFTGADRRREGRFEQANGGTLFLDEVGEIPLATQVKLLRVLQEREFERVGGGETIRTDVRLVAATNRDLEALVAKERYRGDLYYRLNVVNLRVPSLLERRSDIPALALHFVRKFATENDKTITGFDDHALQLLMAHDWPGNVRELENAVERAVVMATANVIGAQDLPSEVATGGRARIPIPGTTLAEFERLAILATVEACGGSTSRAAEILDISVRKIQYKLHEYTGSHPSDVPPLLPDVEDEPD
jgi:two-component system response regulator HydG